MATVSRDELVVWLRQRISKEIGMKPEAVPIDVNLARYGLDSVRAIEITADLSDWFGTEVSATAMWDYHSIVELADAVLNGSALEK